MYSARSGGVVIPEWQQKDRVKVTPMGVGAVRKIDLYAITYGDEKGDMREAVVFLFGDRVIQFPSMGEMHPTIAKKVFAIIEERRTDGQKPNIPATEVDV